MSAWKVSGICALASVPSLVGACIRGDLVCAGMFTGVLILIFCSSGLAAIISVVVAFIGMIRSSSSNADANSN
jgi:hypothetical protein